MTYLLDANVFIQAKNLHYGFDFCPAFWDWIIERNREEAVFSIDKVADELAGHADKLSEWAQTQAARLFLSTDSTVALQFGRVSQWVTTQGYEPAAISTFLQVADYYLIAHGLAGHHVVVTHEIPSDSKRKIKIPNVCIGLGVKFMTPYEMLRREQARFVLGAVS